MFILSFEGLRPALPTLKTDPPIASSAGIPPAFLNLSV